MILHNGELPKGYDTWVSLYRQLEKDGLTNEPIIKAVFLDEQNMNHHHHEYDLSFIKSNAFDEVYNIIPSKDGVYEAKKELYIQTFENPEWLSAQKILERFMNL